MSFSYDDFKSDWRSFLNQHVPGGRYDGGRTAQDMITLLNTYYGEPWRHYHSTEHLDNFQKALREIGCYNPAVRIAGYFHDIVWLPGYPQCEERSAELAAQVLFRLGCRPQFVEDVERLILATKHSGKPPIDEAEAQIRDADLWTLGERDQAKFDATQEAVRREFAHVDEKLYHETRQRLFQRMFVDRIYWTVPGQAREAQARENLAGADIKLLGPGECACVYHWLDSIHYEQIHGSDCVRGYC